MLSQDDKQRRIQAIADFPEHLVVAVSGFDDAQLDTPYREGGWTVRQVVHHMVDSHVNAYQRLYLILAESGRTLTTYDQDAWAAVTDKGMPVLDSLLILKGLHSRLAKLLSGLSDSDWHRTVIHPEEGEVSAEWWLVTYSDHCQTHLKQITDLKDRMNW